MSTREQVQKWYDEGQPCSQAELAQQIGVAKSTVWRIVKSLQPPKPLDETEVLLERCRSGAISDEAANRILGRIMAEGKDADRIKAIDVYDTRNRASTSRIGPQPPQSPQQIVARLGLMFQAADAAQLKEAAHQAGYTLVPNQPAPQAESNPPLAGPDDPAHLASS